MIAIFAGTVVAVSQKTPDKGQTFTPNLSVSLLQTRPDGDVELVKIKDENLSRKYPIGEQVQIEAQVILWQQGDRNGLSIKALNILSPGSSRKAA